MLARNKAQSESASRKYDVLTALGAHACAGTKFQQRLVLRFMTMITARYNWQRNELTMGRAEIARLWQVNERTVKRELGKLKLAGWLLVKRPSARGRVTAYSIDWEKVLDDTRASWPAIGPDFELRLGASASASPKVEKPVQKVVPFPVMPQGDTEWERAFRLLHDHDAAFCANWLGQIKRHDVTQGVLELVTPSSFQADYLNAHASSRLVAAVQAVAPHIHRVVVRSRDATH